MISWLFVILFAVVGGVIAFFADRLGRTLGKKRLRALGLRPRHTAELLTVGAGVLIPIFTVFTVTTLSASAREWLFNSGKWKQDAAYYLKQLNVTKNDLITMRQEYDSERVALLSLHQKLPVLQRKFDGLTAQFKEKSAQLNEVGARLREATLRLQTESAQLSTAKTQLATVRVQLGQVRSLFNRVSADYGDLKPKFADLSTKYGQLKQNYAELATQRDEANKEVVALNKQKDDLSGQVDNLKGELVAVQTDLSSTKTELGQTKSQLESARNDLKAAQFFADKFSVGLANTRTIPVILNRGDELTRIDVPRGASQDRIKQAITQGLKKASILAEERGAGQRAGEYCGLLDLPLQDGTSISIEQQEQECVSELDKTPSEPHVLIFTALYNTVKGEFVPLLIRAMPNPLVYRKHQILADTWLRGGLDNEGLYEQISTFVRTQVRDRAVKDRMLPVQGREDSLGEISPGDIIDLMQKYQKWGSGARLVALADSDTHAADPLRVRFDMQMR